MSDRDSLSSKQKKLDEIFLRTAKKIPKRSSGSETSGNSDYSKNVGPEEPQDGWDCKPICDCEECQHWTTSVDWSTQSSKNQSKKAVRKERRVEPFFKSSKYPGNTPKIINSNKTNMTKVEKLQFVELLVHGNKTVPSPIVSICDTYFDVNIQKAFQLLDYCYSKPIQSYVWPALFREMNVFVIGGKRCGKTMGYIPAICTFALNTDNEYYQDLERHRGPLIIVICPDSRQCEEVYDLIKTVYKRTPDSPKVSLLTYPSTKMNNPDILVTLPTTLIDCLASNSFNLKRLCHLVFESSSVLLGKHREIMNKILNVVNEMTEHRVNSKKVQLIACSENWTTDLENLLKNIYSTPLVCFGNHLEAALYSGIDFEIRFLKSSEKFESLYNVVKSTYRSNKCIVLCSNEEILKLNDDLIERGIETLCLSDKSDKEEIELCENAWSTRVGGKYQVFLCTDIIVDASLTINDAMLLIHYSFPESPTRFAKRFRTLARHLNSPLQRSEDSTDCRTFVFIDESCEPQMPRIQNLLRRLNQELPESYVKYAESFKIRQEQGKTMNGIDICENVKLLGSCCEAFCPNRHIVEEESDVSSELPRTGKVVFRIASLQDVTRFAVQLLEHVDADGNVQKINNEDLSKPVDYRGETPHRASVKLGNYYAHCEYGPDSETYTVCEVLKIIEKTKGKKAREIEVSLKNIGQQMQTSESNLFELPARIKILHMYLCNLIPPYKDQYFSAESCRVTFSSLRKLNYKDKIFTGDVQLQLNDTLWLNNVVEIVRVDNMDLVKFDLSKHLQNKNVVAVSGKQISALYKLCETYGVTLPVEVKTKTKRFVRRKEVEPQWAFMDNEINEVILSSAISPDEFYVRLAKYQSLLINLQKDIQAAIKTEILSKKLDVNVGSYYLVQESAGGEYARALILNKEHDKALCFFVDYGDESVVDLSTIRSLPSKFFTRLPFQAIYCSLNGITPILDSWPENATDILYKYMFEPNSDIFRSLYVKVVDKISTSRTKAKYSIILKDGFNVQNASINQLLVDCGTAVLIDNQPLSDFVVPEPNLQGNDSGNCDSDSDLAGDVDVESKFVPDAVPESDDIDENLEDEVDFQIYDVKEFINVFPALKSFMQFVQSDMVRHKHQIENKTDGESRKSSVEIVELNENEVHENLTPEVYWSQTKDTVKMRIKLIGADEYKANIIQKRIFRFWAKLEERVYELKFTLFQLADIVSHCDKGQEIQVILKKKQENEWDQLTSTKRRLRNIHYEILDHELKDIKRRILTLDITDDELDLEDNFMYVVESDLDSEFDADIASDDDYN